MVCYLQKNYLGALQTLSKHFEQCSLFWQSTVSVHPLHYAAELRTEPHTNSSKRAMTVPRIKLLNKLALVHLKRHNEAHPNKPFFVLDAFGITVSVLALLAGYFIYSAVGHPSPCSLQ